MSDLYCGNSERNNMQNTNQNFTAPRCGKALL